MRRARGRPVRQEKKPMTLTRKSFLLRASAATAAVAATSLAGASAAEAGPSPHMRSVIELMTNAARQLEKIEAGWQDPPEPSVPAIRADLETIRAACAQISATTDRLLAMLGR